MKRTRLWSLLIVAAASVVAASLPALPLNARAAGPSPAAAPTQPLAPAAGDASPNQLRLENERLRERIAQLDAELAEARRRIAKLEESLRTARKGAPAETAPPAQAAPGQVTPGQSAPAKLGEGKVAPGASGPADAFASPEAMYEVLVREFQQTLGDKPRTTDAEMERYLREARRWTRQVSQQKREPVEWTVKFLSPALKPEPAGEAPPQPAEGSAQTEASAQLVNPESGATIGEPFKLMLSGRDLLRLQELPKQGVWVLSGVFAAAPAVITAVSGEPRVFEARRLIGPSVEYRYELSVRSIRPAAQAKAEGEKN